MRSYTDPDGREWDIVVGRESFGALYALFVPRGDNRGDVRQTPLRAESKAGAAAELEELGTDALNALFGRSEPKGLG